MLEVIDPAALPYRSFTMSRKKRVLVGAVAGALLATFAVMAWVILARMVQTIVAAREAQQRSARNSETANGWSSN